MTLTKKAGVRPLAVHSMRHNFANSLLESSGNDVVVTQGLMRHRDIKTTMTYLKPNAKKRRAAVELI